MNDLKNTYNKIAGDWAKDHSKSTWWQTGGVAKFISFLKPGATVLDVGCGPGQKSKYLADKGLKVVGIDFSEKMIELAKQTVPNVDFYVADIKNLSSIKQNFSGIFAQAVLLHIPKNEITQVLNGLKEKLIPSGYFYICVKELRPGNKDEESVIENDYGYEYERFFSYFTLEEIKHYLQEGGMEIVYEGIYSKGDTNWIQVIAQK
jgi:SAM-dependent methyltransferase